MEVCAEVIHLLDVEMVSSRRLLMFEEENNCLKLSMFVEEKNCLSVCGKVKRTIAHRAAVCSSSRVGILFVRWREGSWVERLFGRNGVADRVGSIAKPEDRTRLCIARVVSILLLILL